MGKHGKDKIEGDGQGTYDPDKSKPVEDAGGGSHDKDDKDSK